MARNPELAKRLESVSRITVTGHPLLRQRTDRPAVTSGRASQVSAQHAIAVSLLRGTAGLEEFSDEATRQPDVQALGERVVFEDDPGFSVEGAKLEVVLVDGTIFTETVEHSHGSLLSPMTDREIEDKLRSLCSYGRSGVDAEPLIEAIWRLDSFPDAASALALASPQA
jgi:2-methylcitrate dehydratase PrpD